MIHPTYLRKLILSFVIVCCNSVFGQTNIDSSLIITTRAQLNSTEIDKNTEYETLRTEVESKIDSLLLKGAQVVINFYRYTIGWPDFIDSTGTYDVQYLIWLQSSNTFVQKFVNRNNITFRRPPPRQIHDTSVFSFLKDNYKVIASEEILPFTIKSTKNNIEGYYPVFRTHSSFIRISVSYQDKEYNLSSTIGEFDLEETLSSKERNLNYLYNKSTKLWILQDMLSKLVGTISP